MKKYVVIDPKIYRDDNIFWVRKTVVIEKYSMIKEAIRGIPDVDTLLTQVLFDWELGPHKTFLVEKVAEPWERMLVPCRYVKDPEPQNFINHTLRYGVDLLDDAKGEST